MSSNQEKIRQPSGMNRTLLSHLNVEVSESTSAKRRFREFDDSVSKSPPHSPRVRIKRSTINNILGKKNSDSEKDVVNKQFQSENKSSLQGNSTEDLTLLQTTENTPTVNRLPHVVSWPYLTKGNKISEEITKQNIKAIPSGMNVVSVDSNVSSSVLAERTEKAARELNSGHKTAFISEKQALSSIPENKIPPSHDYFMISKLAGIFKRPPIHYSAIHDNLTKQVSTKTVSSDASENSMVQTDKVTPDNSQLQQTERVDKKESASEKHFIMSGLSTWLTASEIEHTHDSTDSEDEESSLKRTAKTVYQWGTTKKVNINRKDLNMMSPVSL